MADENILSQDEIDALLTGMDGGDVETAEHDEQALNGVIGYDFESQDRIIRGRLPTLEMVNERFARNLRISLFNMLQRPLELSTSSVQMLKFSEYVDGLFMPASMNLVKMAPLRGTALFTFDPKLVFAVVEHYFGGNGNSQAKIEGRDFTRTERRVVQIVLEQAFKDLKHAWEGVLNVDFTQVGSEVNPQFANICSPSEVVVVMTINVEMEGGGGAFHIAMPYSMIEPIRDMLETGMQSDAQDKDDRWARALRAQVETIEVELRSTLGDTAVSLRRLLEMDAGDIVPIEPPENVTAMVEGVPIFRGTFGTSGGNLAIKVTETMSGSNGQLVPMEE